MNTRRQFLGRLSAGLGGAMLTPPIGAAPEDRIPPEPTPEALPRWRGFNLIEKMIREWNREFDPDDFARIADLGFNFARLPMDYRLWADPDDWRKVRESSLKFVDEAVGRGRQRGVHVQINFHRAPGFTVASPPEPKSLWTDAEALAACARHWAHFARRFQGVPNRDLSFNLYNEPTDVPPADHRRVTERVVAAIREQDPGRLIVCDGRRYARVPPTELVGLKVAAALHGYDPHRLTHYRASWVEGSDRWPEPTWPLKEGGQVWDRDRLRREQVEPWRQLQQQGVGVMVGEFGAYNQTPHDVVLSWMRDNLDLWKEAGWGWALWNFRGPFGILDSERPDVTYEPWHGHQLDRAMLDLLQTS